MDEPPKSKLHSQDMGCEQELAGCKQELAAPCASRQYRSHSSNSQYNFASLQVPGDHEFFGHKVIKHSLKHEEKIKPAYS